MQYTYTIKFKPTGQYYHGSRTAKDANPDEFWVTYFTSSNIVKRLIDEHGKDAFDIIDVTPCEDAYAEETRFLRENDCANSDEWLNQSNNDYNLSHGSKEFKKRMKNKYGVEHIMEIPEVREKTRKAMKALWENDEFRQARKELYMERYGVDHHMKNPEMAQRVKDGCIKKYGVDNVFAAEAIKEKIKDTFQERYGCHPRQTEEVKEKYKATTLKEYGVDHYSKTDEFKEKIQKTWAEKDEAELEEIRNKSKSARANDPILECPHCKKMIKNRGLFNRWHNDNCKEKK